MGSMIRALVFFLSIAFVYGQDKRFEVVSVKPSKTGGGGGAMKVMPGGQVYRAQNFPVRLMIGLMYWTPSRQITGGPDWIDSDLWDIEAKTDHGGYDLDEMREMFRNMLTDEFKLKLRKDVKEGPVYALTVDKSGLKMKVNESPQDFEIPIKGGPGGITVGKRVSIERLCWQLGVFLQRDQRPVIDKTGLTGFYDFTLSFLPELPPNVNRDNLPPEMLNRPSLFDALKQQMGLKLEAQKGPVVYYVVESIEKPAGN